MNKKLQKKVVWVIDLTKKVVDCAKRMEELHDKSERENGQRIKHILRLEKYFTKYDPDLEDAPDASKEYRALDTSYL